MRLAARGFLRFEVMVPKADRALIRAIMRLLAEHRRARDTLRAPVAESRQNTGGILAALRRSPLVGAELDLDRMRNEGRTVEL